MVKVSSRPASASSYALVLPMPRLAHSGMKGRKSLCSFVLCIVRLWPHGLARGRNVFNGKLPGSCGIYRNGRGNYRLGDLPNLAQQCSQGLILRPVEAGKLQRSEEHTSELQSLMRISYAVFCLKKNTNQHKT